MSAVKDRPAALLTIAFGDPIEEFRVCGAQVTEKALTRSLSHLASSQEGKGSQ